MRSHEKPIRSSAPGAKFSHRTSHASMSRVNIPRPVSCFVLSVTLRLLWFSIVK